MAEKRTFSPLLLIITLISLSPNVLGMVFEKATLDTGSRPIVFDLEVTQTQAERKQGLMDRHQLHETAGMAFVYPPKSRPTLIMMWMKNTPLSLDILFLDKTGTILYIAKKTVPYSLELIAPPPHIQPQVSAVIELVSGRAEKHQIRPGHTFKFPSLSQCL